MKQWDIGEAARRLHEQLGLPDTHVVWFLGAGCSISSGIPAAGELVQRWMAELRRLKDDRYPDWVDASCPGWEDEPAPFYGLVIDERFGGNRRARQEEIARLVKGREPGFGYACLAQAMSHPTFGRRNNVAFTTNFDDLIADALYLYTQLKPLTVVHEALAGFLRSSESTPLVVKLHGDSQLAPKNTDAETSVLDGALIDALRRVLRDAVLVFIGYGGNDESIASFLEGCRRDEIAGAYWVGHRLPGNERFRSWLTSLEGAVHVDHEDFDAFMAELKAELDLDEPDFDRFDRLREKYRSTANRLASDVDAGSGVSSRGLGAAERSVEAVDAWLLDARARALGNEDADAREALHRRAVQAAPDDADIISHYGIFLAESAKTQQAEHQLRRAIELAPTESLHHSNLGIFLRRCSRTEDALQAFHRAVELSPDDGNTLANYASTLARAGREQEADAAYRRMISHGDADPTHLCLFATFLKNCGELDEAETLYRKAIDIDPGSLMSLMNYASLLRRMGRDDEAAVISARALKAHPRSVDETANLAYLFFRDADRERARVHLIETLDHPEWRGIFDVAVEVLFYAFADRTPGHDSALSDLKVRLSDGQRSARWDFSPVVEAVKDDWGDTSFLHALAKVAADEAPIETLDVFPEWQDA